MKKVDIPLLPYPKEVTSLCDRLFGEWIYIRNRGWYYYSSFFKTIYIAEVDELDNITRKDDANPFRYLLIDMA